MVARKTLAFISVITFAIVAQPTFAANGDNGAQTPSANPSDNSAPAKQPRKHHSGRRHQKPSTQTGTTPNNSN